MIAIAPTPFTLSQSATELSLHGIFAPAANPPKNATREQKQSWTLVSLSVHFVASGMSKNGAPPSSGDSGPIRASRVHNALHPAQKPLPPTFLNTANAVPPNAEEAKLEPGAHQAWLDRVCGPAILALYGLTPAASPAPAPAGGNAPTAGPTGTNVRDVLQKRGAQVHAATRARAARLAALR
jgi:hypothetical protein